MTWLAQRSWAYAVLVLLAGCSYGFTSPVLKIAYQRGFTAAQITDTSFLFSVVLLWTLSFVGRRRVALSTRQWGLLFLIGLVGAGTTVCYFLALTRLPASVAIVLLFQFSWMVLGLDILVRRRHPGSDRIVGVLFIFAGTLLSVGLFGQHVGRFPVWALILGILAAVSYALTLYLSGYVDTSTSPYFRSAVTITLTGALSLFAFPPTHLLPALWLHGLWLWGLSLALVSQVVPSVLLMVAIPRTGGRMAGVLASVELPIAVLGARLLLQEPVSLVRWLGVVLIMVGIVVSERSVWRKRTPPVTKVGDDGVVGTRDRIS